MVQYVPTPHPSTDLNILGTSLVTVYTPNTNRRPVLCSAVLCNTHSGAATVDLVVNDGSTDYYLLEGHSLAASETYVFKGEEKNFIALETTWTIKAKSDTDAVVHCTLNLLETEGRKVT
jgi:hypothetical protein